MSKIKRKINESCTEIPDSCSHRIRTELNNMLGYVPEKESEKKVSYVRRKICIASLVFVLITGSAFDGYKVSTHLIKTEEKENHTLEVSVNDGKNIADENSVNDGKNIADEKQETDNAEEAKLYTKFAIKWNYLPQEFTDEYYWDTIMFRENWSVAGISARVLVYDDKDATYIRNNMVESYEELNINGHEALLVNNIRSTHDNGFNKKLYIIYPEYQRIIMSWIGEKLDKAEMIKIFENVELYDTGETGMYGEMTWKEMAELMNQDVMTN